MIKKITISLALCALTAPCFGAQRPPLSAAEQQRLNARLLSTTGDIEAVRSALQAGAEVNRACSSMAGQPPLHYAALQGQLGILSLLLQYGADINERNNLNYTPLHAAVHGKSVAAVVILLDHNANINEPDFLWRTPLDLAILNNDGEIIAILSRHGAKTHQQQLHQQQLDSDLRGAIIRMHAPKAISLLKQGANANQCLTQSKQNTLLHEAARFSAELITALLEHGALISACDYQGQTPLHYAARSIGKTVFGRIELLLEHGADKNARDFDRKTPRDIALSMCSMIAAHMLQQ